MRICEPVQKPLTTVLSYTYKCLRLFYERIPDEQRQGGGTVQAETCVNKIILEAMKKVGVEIPR